jgi:hypothetical protein
LTGQAESDLLIQAHYDNATKLLKVKNHEHVGAVTYGLGALGGRQPRTAHSYLPEFEKELATEVRLSVEEFATRMGDFFRRQWSAANTPAEADAIMFLVGGFDEGDAYGRVFQVSIPNSPAPVEKSVGDFGITFGGQHEIAGRLLGGYDPRLEALMTANVHLNAAQTANLRQKVLPSLAMPIPYQFLPFLIKTTATLQSWTTGTRGVGGAIDVATITRTDGFRAVQEKRIVGDRSEL